MEELKICSRMSEMDKEVLAYRDKAIQEFEQTECCDCENRIRCITGPKRKYSTHVLNRFTCGDEGVEYVTMVMCDYQKSYKTRGRLAKEM